MDNYSYRWIVTPGEVAEIQDNYNFVISELTKRNEKLQKNLNYYRYMFESIRDRETIEITRLKKENRKLKASLRKMYEKYIKPTKGAKYTVSDAGSSVKPLMPLPEDVSFVDGMLSTIESPREEWRKLALKDFNNGRA